MQFTLAGKAALITGGKRIGAVIASTLAKRGVDIALSYNRSRDEAETTAVIERLRPLNMDMELLQIQNFIGKTS